MCSYIHTSKIKLIKPVCIKVLTVAKQSLHHCPVKLLQAAAPIID